MICFPISHPLRHPRLAPGHIGSPPQMEVWAGISSAALSPLSPIPHPWQTPAGFVLVEDFLSSLRHLRRVVQPNVLQLFDISKPRQIMMAIIFRHLFAETTTSHFSTPIKYVLSITCCCVGVERSVVSHPDDGDARGHFPSLFDVVNVSVSLLEILTILLFVLQTESYRSNSGIFFIYESKLQTYKYKSHLT